MRHGGNLGEAMRRYGGTMADWLDLSTGLNPVSYPVAPSAAATLHRLPDAEREAALLEVARRAYRVSDAAAIAAAPGSQILIQFIARLRTAARVSIIQPTYSEHAIAWAREGNDVRGASGLSDAEPLSDVVVLANPNNPDGRRYEPAALRALSSRLAARGGLLVVDEAFADMAPELSMCLHAGQPGLVVLRSFGKMYGLGGVRLGFVVGTQDDVGRIQGWLGPWSVSGPALEAGIAALKDEDWLREARARVRHEAAALAGVLKKARLDVLADAGLFVLAADANAAERADALARNRIWVRTFDYAPTWLRFGLPGSAAGLVRIEAALGSGMAVVRR